MEIARFLIDFGFFILIWLVQLIIYPSFRHMKKSSFVFWHKKYSKQISYFVAPLLFIQTGLIAYQTIFQFDYLLLADITLIIFVWAITFFLAVPIHEQLNFKHNRQINIDRLVGINWIRTLGWSLLFLCSTIRIFKGTIVW